MSTALAPATSCYPSWHAIFAPMAAGTQVTVFSGCGVNAEGNVACAPESMRANAEAQLKRLVSSEILNGKLSLDTYTLARYMQAEVGDGTIEERVAVGEAAVNQARRGRTLMQLVAPHGYYGPIHAPDSVCEAMGYDCTNKRNVCCAPYGRWASSAKDPTVLTLLLADLITSGRSGQFAQGADDQSGPAAWIRQGQNKLSGWVQQLAAEGKYWIGPLPGVDHWRTFLTFTPGIVVSSPMGVVLLARGLQALTLPAQRPSWAADMPVCVAAPSATSMSGTQKFFVGLAVVGGFIALSWGALRVAKRLAHAPLMLGDDEDEDEDFDADWGSR